MVARRRYDRVDGRGHVEVAFFQPEQDGETGDFRCPFEISGLEGVESIRQQAWGVDSVQALQQAMQGARVALAPHREQLRWLSDSDLGFARYVPNGFGPELDAHFERLIEQEMVRLAPAMKRQWNQEDTLSDMEWLEQWYEAQCREEWAHHQGVNIQSLDNPGWLLKVDLRGTNLEGRMADALVQRTREPPSETNGNQGGDDWMECSIKEGCFIGAGDPRKLRAILNCFRVWARAT
ncbi:immunity 53 family protein [Cystobacter fuscus]|uniref:immunity 53 family protein n=1 Tax=Cystobacter fuscus TaxID=43 RepID=UPI0012FE21FF|nr:immunity 53 family protein [Cystobacter fuscus]